jgi:hypothetical protein
MKGLNSMKSPLLFAFVFVLFTFTFTTTAAAGNVIEETMESVKKQTIRSLQPLHQQYESLPPKARFGVSALGGFLATKLTIRQTVKIAKFGGAAFVISEVMHQTGVLDTIEGNTNIDFDDILSDRSEDALKGFKQKVFHRIDQCRMTVREQLNLGKIREEYKNCLERDKLGTLGFTTGTVAGLVW